MRLVHEAILPESADGWVAKPIPAPLPPNSYADPADPAGLRWWTGRDWSTYVVPAPAPATTHATPSRWTAAAPARAPRHAYQGAGVDPHAADLAADIEGDRFEILQRARLVVNQYDMVRCDPSGARQEQVAWVRQKRLAMKERIDVFTDSTETTLLAGIQARTVFDLRGSYDIVTAGGARLGVLKKRLGRSFIRSTWDVDDAKGEPLLMLEETSQALAMLRRLQEFAGFIPAVGQAIAMLPLPYGFTFRSPSGSVLATHTRVLSLRDRYRLDLTPDTGRVLDRRLAISIAICLDALQSR